MRRSKDGGGKIGADARSSRRRARTAVCPGANHRRHTARFQLGHGGVDRFRRIINPPQVAILAVGAVIGPIASSPVTARRSDECPTLTPRRPIGWCTARRRAGFLGDAQVADRVAWFVCSAGRLPLHRMTCMRPCVCVALLGCSNPSFPPLPCPYRRLCCSSATDADGGAKDFDRAAQKMGSVQERGRPRRLPGLPSTPNLPTLS